MEKKNIIRIFSILFLLSLAFFAKAQRPVEQVLRPTYDSSVVVQALIDISAPVSTVNFETRIARQASPVNSALDETLVVGDVPYNLSTNKMGQVSLSVPVETFATEYELAPHITLQYNSLGGLSFLGSGWSVNGLSSIYLANKSYFTDGTVSGKNRAHGPWSIDGNRLIAQGDSSWFLTQKGDTKVLKTLDGFLSLSPDGTRCTYQLQDTALVEFPVTSVEDINGRQMYFTYSNQDGENLIQSVTYGEGRSLLFSYEQTQDAHHFYEAGVQRTLQSRLNRIEVKHNGRLLRQYSIVYGGASIESPVSQIGMTDSTGRSVNPLKLYYQGEQTGHVVQTSSGHQMRLAFQFDNPDRFVAHRGKLDPASEDDALILYPNKMIYRQTAWPSIGHNDNDEFTVCTKLNEGGQTWKGKLGRDFVDMFLMDVDGNNVDELVKIEHHNQWFVDSIDDEIEIQLYSLVDTGLVINKTFHYRTNRYARNRLPRYFLSGDFDGDGKDDLLEARPAADAMMQDDGRVRLIDLSGDSIKFRSSFLRFKVNQPIGTETPSEIQSLINSSDRLFATDVDGDGKLEMTVLHPNGLNICQFGLDSQGQVTMKENWTSAMHLSDAEGYNVTVGDMNGDRLSDIVFIPNVPGKNVIVHYSKGDLTFFTDTLNLVSSNETEFMSFDFDQDGQTDIVEYYNPEYAGVANDTTFRNQMWVHTIKDGHLTMQDYTIGRGKTILVPANIYNGSANSCLVSINNDGTYELHRCSDPKNMDALLTAVADSRGCVSRMEYRQLYQSEHYQPGFNMTFPYSVYAGGLFVNSAMKTTVGNQTERNLSFNYHNATIHKQGLGFCGFQGIATYDSIRNESTYQIFDPTHFGVPVSVVSEQETRGYGYQTTVANDKRIQILLKNDTITNHATGVTAINAYTHDTYGNVLTSTTSLPGNITKIITNEYANIITEGHWLIGLERRHTESVTRGDSTLIEGRTTTYNGSWLPDTVVTWCGSEQNPVLTQMIRYNNNRPDRVKTRAYMGTTLIRHIGYSADSRLPQFVSDERGMRTTYAYGCFGVTQSSLTPETGMWVDDDELPDTPIVGPLGPLGGGNEINGGGQNILDPPPFILPEYPTLDTYYHYDSFGRQDSITAPDGSVKAVSLAWASDVPGALYMSEQSETNKPSIRTWFDTLGRKVREGTQRANGTWTYTLYEYNTLGLLARESLPTTTGNASSWTTYSYEDTFDRLEEKEYPDGHSDTYAYSGLTTTSVIDGVTTSRTVDALGDLVSVTDGGGTLLYDLRPDGQPREIRAPGNIATTFTYDQYGRRISISDPSAGTRTTTYDANGHVASETDARGKTITSTYTTDGRLTSRTFSNTLSVNYSYNSWNMPTRMTGSDGHSKSWTYNDLQQLTSESTDGFRKAYTYDQNMLASVAYSKDNGYICSENYTRMNGHLTSVTLNTGDTIWALDKQNPRMLPTKVRLGKLSQSLSYDVYGRVTGREVTDREHEDLQYLQYYYNMSTGNMTLRWDHVNGTDETFSYDALNRLTGILPCNSSSCMLSQSTSYDGKGNITSHHTSGQYTYGFNNGNGTSQPYAFSELSSPSSLIPQREQHISYNAMQQPDTIREGSYLATFCYYGDMTRASMTVTDTVTHNVETRTYYDQQYNEFTKTTGNTTLSKRILWLGGSPYNAPAALVKRYGEQNWTLVHVLRDNLGSITHVVDTTGVVLQEMGYSAWGLVRDVESLDPYSPDSQPELLLGRGYTGHEHLPWFGLVNMNARLYDPAVGRFLSPDPIVQAPDNTQNYNRYSYCLNNPLRFVDESGLIAYKTFSPAEISRALRILGDGGNIDDIIGGGGNGGWNRSAWEEVDEWDVYVDYIYLNSFNPVNGRKYQDGTYLLADVTVNVWRFPKFNNIFVPQPIDYSMSIMYGHDRGIENAGIINSLIGVPNYLLRHSKATYSLIDKSGHIEPRLYKSGWKGNKYVSPKSIKGLAKPLVVVSGVITAADILNTGMDGHIGVAVAKGAVAGAEYALSTTPVGIALVIGFELLDSHYHFMDKIYKEIDSSY